MKYLTFLLLLIAITLNAKEYSAYKIFDKNGVEVTFKEVLEEADQNEIILFGELHNSPIDHWLQLQMAKSLYEKHKDELVIGAEMFETDDQMIINEYFDDFITEKNFEKESKLWNNYKTDYKPVLEFAKEKKIDFIATNIPRRYASLVAKKGFEALDDLSRDAKDLIAPLDIDYDPELPGYKKMAEMSMPGHGMDFIAEAQAIKDATMAHYIEDNMEGIFLHLNGTYHSNNFEGIYWYLKNEDDDLKIMTIGSVQQENIDKLADENKNLADFIIVKPSDMTTTY